MAIVTDTVAVQRFAMGLFGVQVGTVTMAQVDKQIDRSSLSATLNSYYTSAFGGQTTAAVAATLVANLGITGAGVAGAVAYVTAKLNAAAPAARGEAINTILNDFSGMTADATYGAAAQTWNANVEVAAGYTGDTNVAFGAVVQQNLSVGMDVLFGSAGADVFTARVVQNVNGEQTNQLATGDVINGGAGVDTLAAKIIAASSLNLMPASAIAAETVGVEKLSFTAMNVATAVVNPSSSESAVPQGLAEINAKFMNGVTTISSVHSDATLLVTNVNTLKDDGVYANKRLTEALTVRMDHSGNGEATSAASNMAVLLDNDYLLRGDGTSSAALTVVLSPQIEEKNYKVDAPLTNNPYNELTFKIDGVSKTIKIGTGTANTPVVSTYADLKAAIEAGLKAAGLTDVTVTQNVGAYEYFSRDGVARKADTFTLAKDGAILASQGAGTWVASAGLPDSVSFGAEVLKADAVTTKPQITINVELEKVGRGSDGGELVIGGMATDGENKWDYSKTALEEGIEKFNVTVSGDASQFSSLAGLHSTNNTLQTVVVTSAKGSAADLIIGNSNTRERDADGKYINGTDITDALKDVRDFNSTAFANDLTLNASVTDEAVAKYMNLKDTAAPAADNANFAYNFGAGNDTLNLVIDNANLAAKGTTTREDFSMAINTGAGDDKVTVAIEGDNGGDNWMANSNLLRNLSITTGEGADTVHMKGDGTWNVATGAGNDTVYSDNTGDKAVWVFNTADQITPTAADDVRNIDDLKSDNNDSITLYKGTVAVSFKGLKTAAVEIASTKYKSTDLQINQAIKEAINKDAVLSKLLVAVDGPANTLIVKSLIDGEMAATDLALTFGQGSLTAAETTAATAAGYTAYANAAAVATAVNNGTSSDYVAAFAWDATKKVDGTPVGETTGDDSDAQTINVITGGAGKDVIVLSTGDANDVVPSTDTVVLNSTAAADADVIVNFTSGSDKIHLSKAAFAALGAVGTAVVYNAGTAAATASAGVVFDATTGALYYDADGTGSGAAVQIATLIGTTTLAATDFAIIA